MNNYNLILLLILLSRSMGYVHDTNVKVLTNGSYIVVHDLKRPLPVIKDINIKEQNQLSNIYIPITQNITLKIKLRVRNVIDQYKEVLNSADDNQFVMQSHPQSDIFHLREPMSHIIDNYCSRPLPKQYYIIKDTYRGRSSLAHAQECTMENIKKGNKDSCEYLGQNYYRRTINEPCAWKKNDKVILHDEDQEQLQFDLNSILCVENSPILRKLFRENIEENEQFLLDPECEFAKARCTDCQILRCKSRRLCCSITANCLLNEHCLKYYSHECDQYSQHNRTYVEPMCMKGTTYKLTLTPEFEFDRKHFLCHLERENQIAEVYGKVSILGMKDFPSSLSSTFHGSFGDFNISIIPNFNIIHIPSLIKKMNNVIFERRGYEYFLHSVKSPFQFVKSSPKVYTHFSKTYVKVQFQNPFQFTTGTWSKETCNLNTSQIFSSQTIYDNHSTVPIRLVHKPFKGTDQEGTSFFKYKMLPVVLDAPKISLRFYDRSSILNLFFCNLNSINPPWNVTLTIGLSITNSWILHIQGEFSGSFTFFTIKIVDDQLPSDPLFNSDIIITNKTFNSITPERISLLLLLSINERRKSVKQFHIFFYQCNFMFYKKVLFLKTNYNPFSISEKAEVENPKDISNFLLTFFLSILSVCFLYFLLLAFQALRRSSKVLTLKVPKYRRRVTKKLNYKFFLKAILYLTLKLFYTVSFTLSLILSVCLSLNTVLNYSTFAPLKVTNHIRNVTTPGNFLNTVCKELEGKRSERILIKLPKIISYNEHIRSNSSQSTQETLLTMLHKNPINKTKQFFNSVITSAYLGIDEKLKRVLGDFIKIYTEIKELKWISILKKWNNSATKVAFVSEFKGKYLDTFNLLKIFPGTSALENCVIIQRKISNIQEKLNINLKYKIDFPEPRLTIPKGFYQRYFINQGHREIQLQIPLKKVPIPKINKTQNIVSIDITQIRLIFMLIDTVLIAYRFYWTFEDIQQMWRSKKEVIHYRKISKEDHQFNNDRTKRNAVSWTKQHHLECLISSHLIISAIIIILSIVCTNLIILLTSKDHANWISKKSGNFIRVRSLRMIKDRMSQFNSINILPVQRHWEYVRAMKVKEVIMQRLLASNKMMNLELYFNRHYFYELCHFQKNLSPSKESIDFCSSIMPSEQIIPEKICDKFSNCPLPLSYNFSTFTPSETIRFFNTYIHFFVHVLAIVIVIAAFIGIVKIFRKQIGNRIINPDRSSYIVFLSHNQYMNHCNESSKMKVPLELSNIYSHNLNPPNQYQCWKNKPLEKKNTAF